RTSKARYQQMAGMRGEGTEDPCAKALAAEKGEKDEKGAREALERCRKMMQSLGMRPCEGGAECSGAERRMSTGSPSGQSGARPGEGQGMGQAGEGRMSSRPGSGMPGGMPAGKGGGIT